MIKLKLMLANLILRRNEINAIQDAIMPFHDLLPKRLQGKNERIDEPLA